MSWEATSKPQSKVSWDSETGKEFRFEDKWHSSGRWLGKQSVLWTYTPSTRNTTKAENTELLPKKPKPGINVQAYLIPWNKCLASCLASFTSGLKKLENGIVKSFSAWHITHITHLYGEKRVCVSATAKAEENTRWTSDNSISVVVRPNAPVSLLTTSSGGKVTRRTSVKRRGSVLAYMCQNVVPWAKGKRAHQPHLLLLWDRPVEQNAAEGRVGWLPSLTRRGLVQL